MDDSKDVLKRIENIVLRIAVIGLGLSFIYFGFFIEEFEELYKLANILFYTSLIVFACLIIYKLIKKFL